MRRLLVLAAVLALPNAGFAAQGGPEGTWAVAGGSARIRIAPCAGQAAQLCGAIVWIRPRPPQATAAAKPAAPAPANRPVAKSPIGQTIMADFKPAGPNKWKGRFQFGQGKSLGGNMSLNTDGTLHVGACVLAICKGQDWKRVS